MPVEVGEYVTGMIDVSGLSLRDLDGVAESSLAHALRGLLEADEAAPVAGFSAVIRPTESSPNA